MIATIVRDRLTQRARVLRIKWHDDGDTLLANGKYLDFADGLLRLVRELDAISTAIERLPQSEYSFLSRRDPSASSDRGAGSRPPSRGPTNNRA